MTVIRLIAFAIFIISCIVIYHNTNSFEPKRRIIYIAVGMVIMYIITIIICNIATSKIEPIYKDILKDILHVIKIIFTPVNAMIVVSLIGKTLGKVKDGALAKDKAKNRLIAILVAFILILIYETNYIGNFAEEILGQL